MSFEALDWDTVSLRLESSTHNPKINQKNLKESSLSAAIEMKDYKILQYLTKTRDGLLNDDFRRLAWPVLLGADLLTQNYNDELSWKSLPPHKDEDQVGLDVERSFVYYPQNIQNHEKTELKKKLKDIIIRVLRTNRELSYYQGYHDICTVFLIIFQNDLELCFKVVNLFTLCYLRDFMMPNIDVTVKILKIIPELTLKVDKELYNDAMMENLEPFYCLSPLITLFSHDLTSFKIICQIFDFIIASGSISVVLYLYVSLLSNKKDLIFEKISMLEDPDCFSRQDLIHDSLSKFLRNIDSTDINDGLENSLQYIKRFPLSNLRKYKEINKYSVLRTSPFIQEINKDILLARIHTSDSTLLSKQIEEAKKLTSVNSKDRRLFSLKDMISSKRNQHLFTVSITIGILSLLLNILLNKTNTSQLIHNILNLWNQNQEILNVGIRPFRDFFMRPF